MLSTSVGPILYLLYHPVINNEDYILNFHTNEVWIFDSICDFDTNEWGEPIASHKGMVRILVKKTSSK